MALPKTGPINSKPTNDSNGFNHVKGEFADRYNVAAQYIHHIIKIINGTCSQKTRYRNKSRSIFHSQQLCFSTQKFPRL